jgi:Flp pilus assembly protein TadG
MTVRNHSQAGSVRVRLRRGEAGQAMAELALLLPVLLLLVFGMIEMSNAWRTFQVVTNSAREGARVGILATANATQVTDRVEQSLRDGSLDPDAATIVLSCAPANDPGNFAPGLCTTSGGEFRVGVSLGFTFNVLGRLANLVPITISSSASMRRE